MSVLHFKTNKSIFALILILLLSFSFVNAQNSRTAQGNNGMVATAHPLASGAALKILKMGGNAVDAAVAAAFTIGVVEPDGSGLGGGGGMVIYLKEQNKPVYINYYQQASEKINEITYDRNKDRHTAKSILIPGTVEGLTTALRQFGTLPLATVMEPAIYYAENGFEIDETLAKIILDNVEMLQIDAVTSSVFLDEDFPRMEGDSLKQPQLAKTLRIISRQGRDGFYGGAVAKEIISRVSAGGGVMTPADLKNYKAEVTVPLQGTYHGYKVLSANIPQSGATIIQSLNMLENVDLKKMGHFTVSARTLHLMAETFRRSYTDRWTFIGDPRFGEVPVKGLLSKEYAKKRFNEINPTKAVPPKYRKTKAGNPFEYNSQLQESDKAFFEQNKVRSFKQAVAYSWVTNSSEAEYDGGHTTHLSVIDKDGNAVSLTQTLGTFFGSGKTYAGVLFNCGMSNYSSSAKINMVKPGMRPRSSIAPTIVLKGQNPFMIVGSPGAGRIIATVVELIVNAVDFGMDVTQTNDAPRFYCQKWDDYLHIEYGISQDVQKQLKAFGHTIKYYEAPDLFFGGAQLIYIDPKTGVYYGSADKRRGGVAMGY